MLRDRVSHILTPDIVGVSSQTHVSEAIRIMRGKNISCILVLEGDKPVGIFTERNIVCHVAEEGADFADREIREVMSSPVLTAPEDMYIYEAFDLLTTEKIRHLVVMDEQGRATGVITQSNIIGHLGYDDFLEIKKVSQIMTGDVCTVPVSETVHGALIQMAEKSISCLIVAENDHPVGILTERDAARLVSEQRDIRRLRIEEVMSRPPETVQRDTPAYEAVRIMLDKGIRRLVVVNHEGKIEGLTTQSDIVKGLEGRYIEILKQLVREKDTALQDTLRELYEKTVYLDNILRSSIDMGIVATDMNLRIVYYNPTAEDILGYPAKDVVGRNASEVHLQEDVESPRLNQIIRRVRNQVRHTFTFKRRKTSGDRFIQARVSGIRDKDGQLAGFVLMLRDITERKKAEETIRHMAYHDVLTGLPNRELFNERLALELAHAGRNKLKLAVMVLDLDRFKEINDTMGHPAGDMLLKSVSARLNKLLRKSDTVARMGGDEFMLILPKMQEVEDAVKVGEKIAAGLSEPLLIDGRGVQPSVSIGISVYPLHGDSGEELIRTADNAMYRAKEQGGRNLSSNVHLYQISNS